MWQEIVLSICLYYIGFFTGKKRGKSEQHKEDYDEVVKTIQELKDSKGEEASPFIVITKKWRAPPERASDSRGCSKEQE